MRAASEWLRWHSVYSHTVARAWVRLPEKWRWAVVHHLDRSQRRCWSDLVSDAFASRNEDGDACNLYAPRPRPDGATRCRTVCDWSRFDHVGEHECACYCGKFRFVAADGAIERRGVGGAS